MAEIPLLRPAPWCVLLAAGRGERLAAAAGCPKQFLDAGGVPLFWLSVRALRRVPELGGIVFVFPEDSLKENEALVRRLAARDGMELPLAFAPGGPRRQDSVLRGLLALPEQVRWVLVHDSARPFFSPELVRRVLLGLARGNAAVIPGLSVTDTVKVVSGEGFVEQTLDRGALKAVQTPQGFELKALLAAHRALNTPENTVTDDASLMEAAGHRVLVVEGEARNMKITRPEDLAALDMRPSETPVFCTGFGYDVHRYGGTRPMVLGGVSIATDLKVAAHSDGDVLLHALMDALLGLAGLGDIGRLFPDTDPAYEGADSARLLREVLKSVRAAGVRLQHADLTVICQKPKLAPYREAIAERVAGLLGLERTHVNVKATTEEGLGFTGEMLGIKACAAVSGLRLPA